MCCHLTLCLHLMEPKSILGFEPGLLGQNAVALPLAPPPLLPFLHVSLHLFNYFQVARSAEIFGYFVPPTTWCPMITQRLQNDPSQSDLMILAKVLDGSDPELLKYCLEDLAITLQNDAVCLSSCVSV